MEYHKKIEPYKRIISKVTKLVPEFLYALALLIFALWIQGDAFKYNFKNYNGSHEVLLYISFFLLLVPLSIKYFRKLDLLGIFGFELRNEVRGLKEQLYTKRVITNDEITYYFCDNDEILELPDENTKKFFLSYDIYHKPLTISDEEVINLKNRLKYRKSEMISDILFKYLENTSNIYAIINGKKYYIGSMSQILDLGINLNNKNIISKEDLKNLPTGA